MSIGLFKKLSLSEPRMSSLVRVWFHVTHAIGALRTVGTHPNCCFSLLACIGLPAGSEAKQSFGRLLLGAIERLQLARSVQSLMFSSSMAATGTLEAPTDVRSRKD